LKAAKGTLDPNGDVLASWEDGITDWHAVQCERGRVTEL
jgi:hypothetical protein